MEKKLKAIEEIAWRALSGKRFNDILSELPPIKFYKLTNKSENHRGFQYVTGLNIDTQIFYKYINSPGLHFTQEKHIDWWKSNFKNNSIELLYKRRVIIPDDAIVYCEYNQIKANKIILGEREDI